jgi:hypothetical protein
VLIFALVVALLASLSAVSILLGNMGSIHWKGDEWSVTFKVIHYFTFQP